uniref:KRAB domain-containing protein n=1 Tax=Laticauda laticaudata TaxID=8630 RepID=A0A8C5RPL4_LATLA
ISHYCLHFEVAVYFSEEEWFQLDPDQKALHLEVIYYPGQKALHTEGMDLHFQTLFPWILCSPQF